MDVTLAEIAELVGGEVAGDATTRLTGLAGAEAARPGDLTFVRAPGPGADADAVAATLASTRAAAIVLDPSLEAPGRAVVRVDDPEAAFNRVCRRFGPVTPTPPAGIHPTAVVDPDASVDPTAGIGPFVVVEAGASIGPRTTVGAHGYVGHAVTIGADCRLLPRVVVRERCTLGDRVVVEPGTVIGSDGFGFEPGPEGPRRIPQIGRVVIEDDVEIGAGCAIDRARLDETRLGKGSKLDNLVHLGHNVKLGAHCLFAAQVGVAGTTTFGRGVEVGGQAGFRDHIHIGDGTKIGAQSGILKSTEPGTSWFGSPAFPMRDEKRAILLTHELGNLVKRIKALETAVRRPAE